jgi:hypothetical protein
MPDFHQPGNEGALPDGFTVWRRGVTYTVRPEILMPLHRGQEYRINVTVRRKIAKDEEFTAYGDLYRRCTEILRARSATLTSCNQGDPLHTWVQWHAWWCGAVADKYPTAGDYKVACASVTVGLAHPKMGEPRPRGQCTPELAELVKPCREMADQPASERGLAKQPDETHIVFDFNDPASASTDITLS